MFCPKCGTKNVDGAKFCTGCGAPLGPAPAAPVGGGGLERRFCGGCKA